MLALAKVFKSGNSVAIRIPRCVDLKDIKEFEIETLGESLILKPKNHKDEWSGFFSGLSKFKDVLETPKDEIPQERDFGKIST